MWIIGLVLDIGDSLFTFAFTLFPMHPKEVESQAAAWLSHFGFSEWAKGLTDTTDPWVSTILWILLVTGIGPVLMGLVLAFFRKCRRRRDGKFTSFAGKSHRVRADAAAFHFHIPEPSVKLTPPPWTKPVLRIRSEWRRRMKEALVQFSNALEHVPNRTRSDHGLERAR